MTGFVASPTKEIAYDGIEPAPGYEPFRATIKRLTLGEVEAVPYGVKITYADAFFHIAPYVLAWNAVRFDAITGEEQPVPPPAEIGPDAFKLVEPEIGDWLLDQCKFGHRLHLLRPKVASGSNGSAPTPTPALATP